MSDHESPSDVVFLLGAGSSVKAGVPDTFQFVAEFQQSERNAQEQQTIDKIIETLKRSNGPDIDVELLLETLTKLQTKDEEPLLSFYEGGTFILGEYPEKDSLVSELKNFIKKKAIIRSTEQTTYLEPLRGFVEEHKPLDIISVNYDTCIEHFCSTHNLDYQDGFDVNWNPDVFERANVDIRLYKLHGSVIWYRSDRGSYLKLPIMSDAAQMQLITGEKAESLMLYPMQKFDYAEPLLELLMAGKKAIQNCSFLIVVGYSFRDEHITRIILDIAAKNRALTVLLIDPRASEIYESKLKYLDPHRRVASSLDGKVVCLPYRFEEAVKFLKDHYLRRLRDGVFRESALMSAEWRGEATDWLACLESMADAEHTSRAEHILRTKITAHELDGKWQVKVRILLRMLLNLLANDHEADATEWLEDLKSTLGRWLSDGLVVSLSLMNAGTSRSPDVLVAFEFRDGKSSSATAGSVSEFVNEERVHLQSRFSMTKSKSIHPALLFVVALADHLSLISESYFSFDDYVSATAEHAKDGTLERLKTELLEMNVHERRESLAEAILMVERRIVADLLA